MVKQNTIGVGGSRRTSVEVLLAENVTTLGQQGDIVKVKPGFARNFLLPQGLATIATEHNKLMVQKHKERTEAALAAQVKQYRKQADAISKYSVTLEANANEEGQLYGSIVATNIAEALKAASFNVLPSQILLEGPLKELGMYTIKVSLHEKVQTEVKVWVVPTAAE
ncbi:LSU ribosomal protein L9p [hydrothermal vent metagenome]|uniref:LSU ribosomal protein L9p n=1 Tax=hydrothermal vent metagenome TaxID=652676 RepID=A0A3B1E6Z4_9ZZZZ